MKKIAVLAVDGVEETECLTTVDFCRRAGIDVTTVSVTGKKQILGSHHIIFHTDTVYDEVDFDDFDGIVYPGGPGTAALGEAAGTRALAKQFLEEGKLVAAICAAPGMLSETGLLKGRKATGYPGCKPEGGADWTENATVTDGNLVTGRGPGAASYFALAIIGYLLGAEKEAEIYASTMMP
ncbi:MAG: DJ-1/PfpI family protein [Lachnospiraceae bacterium]|nr:DJ-1/PfpI family protein [Lachnospiraceae bacterium]